MTVGGEKAQNQSELYG